MRLATRLVYVLAATVTQGGALADVLTVDAAGGADFLDIPEAVAAAADGDTLIIAAGDYSGFTIQGLDLSLLGSGTGVTRVRGSVRVDALAAGEVVLLDRLSVMPLVVQNLGQPGLRVTAGQGIVHAQHCTFLGVVEHSGVNIIRAFPAASLESGSVFLSDCQLTGAWDVDVSGYTMDTSSGMRIMGAEVALDHCTSTGGQGFTVAGFGSASMDGAPGVRLFSGALFASSTAMVGGRGGDGANDPSCFYPPVDGSAGGAGLQASVGSTLIGCTLAGGQGGAAPFDCPQWPFGFPGDPGPPFTGVGPTLLPGPARTSEWTSRWWEPSACGGLRVEVELAGAPGDDVFLALSDRATYMFVASLAGVWLPLNPAVGATPIATLPASGRTSVVLDLPGTLLGRETADHFIQAYFVDTVGTPFLGTPGSVVVLSTATSYCTASANSTGNAARIEAWGSPSIATNDLNVTASSLPMNRFGYLLSSGAQGAAPLPAPSQGTLCLALPIVRGAIVDTGAAGAVTFDVDLQALPVTAGDTWSFQLWFRDVNPGTTSNTTDGVAVVLCD